MPTTILDGETYEQALHRRFTEEAKVIEKMQQDEIICMAREARLGAFHLDDGATIEALERFAALVAAHEREKHNSPSWETVDDAIAAEREACAKVCEELDQRDDIHPDHVALNCAAAIRGMK